MNQFSICTLLATLLIIGCKEETESRGRLLAAQSIENESARNNALVSCAESASEAGDVEVVQEAVSALTSETRRNNTGLRCSEILSRHGHTVEATTIARSIEDQTTQQNAFSRIANGVSSKE